MRHGKSSIIGCLQASAKHLQICRGVLLLNAQHISEHVLEEVLHCFLSGVRVARGLRGVSSCAPTCKLCCGAVCNLSFSGCVSWISPRCTGRVICAFSCDMQAIPTTSLCPAPIPPAEWPLHHRRLDLKADHLPLLRILVSIKRAKLLFFCAAESPVTLETRHGTSNPGLAGITS